MYAFREVVQLNVSSQRGGTIKCKQSDWWYN
jgi:hypothetical protein